MTRIEKDAKLIDLLGGPAKVAGILGYPMPFGVQRVSNWRVRGIPFKVKVDRPDLFLRPDVFGASPACECANNPQQEAA